MDLEDKRRTFQKAYLGLCISFWFICGAGWGLYGLTQSFLKGTGGYQGVLIGMASMVISQAINCGIIASKIRVIRYQAPRSMCCSIQATIGFVAFFPVTIMLCAIAVIAVSAVFGVHYADRTPDDKEVNVTKNEIMGIVNVVYGVIAFLISATALYIGTKLNSEWCRARNSGEGIFAIETGNGKV